MKRNKNSRLGLCMIILILLISLKPAVGQDYQMVVHNKDGTIKTFAVSEIKELTFSGITGLNDLEKINNASLLIELLRTYPNPVKNETTIEYRIEKPGPVRICIYNQQGILIKELLNKKLPAGEHKVVWDTGDKSDSKTRAGIYLCTINSRNQIHSKRIIVIN